MLLNSAAIPLPGGFADLEIPLPDLRLIRPSHLFQTIFYVRWADLWEPKRMLSLS